VLILPHEFQRRISNEFQLGRRHLIALPIEKTLHAEREVEGQENISRFQHLLGIFHPLERPGQGNDEKAESDPGGSGQEPARCPQPLSAL
jgi:hypothetical protein